MRLGPWPLLAVLSSYNFCFCPGYLQQERIGTPRLACGLCHRDELGPSKAEAQALVLRCPDMGGAHRSAVGWMSEGHPGGAESAMAACRAGF